MTVFNGHKDWDHWNVALWIGNDESLYRLALDCINEKGNKDDAAAMFYRMFEGETTPDGAVYTVSNIRAAMDDM